MAPVCTLMFHTFVTQIGGVIWNISRLILETINPFIKPYLGHWKLQTAKSWQDPLNLFIS